MQGVIQSAFTGAQAAICQFLPCPSLAPSACFGACDSVSLPFSEGKCALPQPDFLGHVAPAATLAGRVCAASANSLDGHVPVLAGPPRAAQRARTGRLLVRAALAGRHRQQLTPRSMMFPVRAPLPHPRLACRPARCACPVPLPVPVKSHCHVMMSLHAEFVQGCVADPPPPKCW